MAKLRVEFETVRSLLRDERFASRRTRALAYWALPSDRRLPFALIDRTLDELLAQPFEVHAATSRIGVRKLRMFVTLLQRAALDEPMTRPSDGSEPGAFVAPDDGFDPQRVSEQQWTSWRETISRHGLEDELLGRLSPTLQSLPTVIWRTPLRTYLSESLQAIWTLPTHGTKRVGAVLRVFYLVHQLLHRVVPGENVRLRIVPRFVLAAEDWLWQSDQRSEKFDETEIRQALVLPILNQIQLDAGPLLHDLIADRLGIEAPPKTVREQSLHSGLTRSRIYQLFHLAHEIMKLRWPAGGPLLRYFLPRIGLQAEEPAWRLAERLADTFYPLQSGLPARGLSDAELAEVASAAGGGSELDEVDGRHGEHGYAELD